VLVLVRRPALRAHPWHLQVVLLGLPLLLRLLLLQLLVAVLPLRSCMAHLLEVPNLQAIVALLVVVAAFVLEMPFLPTTSANLLTWYGRHIVVLSTVIAFPFACVVPSPPFPSFALPLPVPFGPFAAPCHCYRSKLFVNWLPAPAAILK